MMMKIKVSIIFFLIFFLFVTFLTFIKMQKSSTAISFTPSQEKFFTFEDDQMIELESTLSRLENEMNSKKNLFDLDKFYLKEVAPFMQYSLTLTQKKEWVEKLRQVELEYTKRQSYFLAAP